MARQDELVPGAGHGDIEYALFFGRPFPAQLGGDTTPDERRIGHAPFRVVLLETDAQAIVKEYLVLRVAAVKGLAHIGDEDDGEFQAFALMDTHDAHDVFLFTDDFSRRQVQAVFFHLIHELQVAEEAAEAGFFVLPGPVVQGFQIGLAHIAARHGPDEVDIGRIIIQALQEFCHAVAAAVRAPRIKGGHELLQVLFFIYAVGQRSNKGRQVLPQRPVTGQADTGQSRLIQADQRRPQDSRHGQVLFGIIDTAQEGQHDLDFDGGKITATLFGI